MIGAPLRGAMAASLRAGLVAGCALALLGCIAGPAPRDHFYRITPPAPPAGEAVLEGTLEVERFSSDDTLRNRRILKVVGESPEVTPYRYHLWADSPTLLLQRALADHLRTAGVAELVVTPDAGATEDWQVNGHLRRLDHVLSGAPAVHFAIELRLRRAEGETLLAQRVYSAEQPCDDASPEAAARAFSAAVGQVWERFTADLRAAAPR